MLILKNLLGLKSKQDDVTATCLHATLKQDENVYVEMPLDFKQCGSNGKFKFLFLKNNLCGFHQSPHAFWKYLIEKVGNCGLPKILLTPASSLLKSSFPSIMLMIKYSGQEMKRIF